MAARKRESEGRNSDLVRLGARFDAGSCSRPKLGFGQVQFPLINSSQNRWYLARNAQNRKIWKSGILGILKSYFWKVSFSFINSSQNRWYLARNTQNRKIPKFARACSCLLVLSLCLLMLAREWPCSSRSHSPKSRFWSVSVPFINSAQNRWYLDRNTQNRKIWKSGILGILNSYFWKVSFSFINSSQNRWYLARNAQNRKIPNLLALARACLCSACAC